jgi:adenylosuccinate lyase
VARAIATRAHLRDVVLADATAMANLQASEVAECFDAASYLGSAEAFTSAALARARASPVMADKT